MKFQLLPTDYQKEHIQTALLEREREWFHYEVDRRNFLEMLGAFAEDDPRREDLAGKVAEITLHQSTVDLVYSALQSRLGELT